MPKRKNLTKRQIRADRFSIPLSQPEKNLIGTAAGIAGETPTTWARGTLKRFARMVLQKAGVKVRLDVDMPEAPRSGLGRPRRLKAPQPTAGIPMANGSVLRVTEPSGDRLKGSGHEFRFPVPEEDE